MKLIAKKPCSFGGKQFFIGNEIPSELVVNPKTQEKMGVIAIVGDATAVPVVGSGNIEIIIHAEEGDLPLNVTNEELSIFTDILQMPVSKTEDKQKVTELIQNIDSIDLLIMLDALDGRKFIKDEAQARAQSVQTADDEEPEQESIIADDGSDSEDSSDEKPGGDE